MSLSRPSILRRLPGPSVVLPCLRTVALVAALSVVLISCTSSPGDDADETSTGVETTPAAGGGASPSEPAASAAPAPEELTADDNGRRIALTVGQQLPLRLAGDRTWTDPVVEGDAVVLSPVDYFADPGFREWTVTAQSPGEAVVYAEGTPNCAEPASCPALTLRVAFDVTG